MSRTEKAQALRDKIEMPLVAVAELAQKTGQEIESMPEEARIKAEQKLDIALSEARSVESGKRQP